MSPGVIPHEKNHYRGTHLHKQETSFRKLQFQSVTLETFKNPIKLTKKHIILPPKKGRNKPAFFWRCISSHTFSIKINLQGKETLKSRISPLWWLLPVDHNPWTPPGRPSYCHLKSVFTKQFGPSSHGIFCGSSQSSCLPRKLTFSGTISKRKDRLPTQNFSGDLLWVFPVSSIHGSSIPEKILFFWATLGKGTKVDQDQLGALINHQGSIKIVFHLQKSTGPIPPRQNDHIGPCKSRLKCSKSPNSTPSQRSRNKEHDSDSDRVSIGVFLLV